MLNEIFKLKDQSVLIVDVNPRVEIHGTENKLAADIKLSMKVLNHFLDRFDKDLRTALFWRAPTDAGENEDLVNEADPSLLPNIRFKQMNTSFSWDFKGAGYRFVVPSVLGKDDLVLIQCDIDKVQFEIQEGGSVIVVFRVVAHPNDEDMGHLCGLMKQEVELTLEPPSPEEQMRRELENAA